MNPQPVHLEVDSAFRLTRAKKALADGAWDEVIALVGSYPSEVPIARESEEAARFVRAHAQAGKGDVVSARRELRGALATASDPHELVRILLDEYPGPAADIARQEASQPRQQAWAAQVTAPAQAAAYRQAGRRVKKRSFAVFGMIGCTTLLPVFIFLIPMLVPSLFFRSCGMGDVETQVVQMIEACPSARAALGEDVAPAPGMSCGNLETGGGSGYADWSYAVSGSNGRGNVSFQAIERRGVWTVQNADLDVDGRSINLVACGNAARMGLDADEVTIPGLLHGLDLPGLAGQVQGESDDPGGDDGRALNIGATMLQGQCDGGDMNACYALGMMYRTMPEMQDEAKASELIERACEGGHSGACSAMGR